MTLQRQDSLVVDGISLPLITEIVEDLLEYPDINGGTIDGTPIGTSTPTVGTFTTLTATSRMAVGTEPIDSASLKIDALDTNPNDYGHFVYLNGVLPTSVTSTASGITSLFTTAAASYTLTNKIHFRASAIAVGTGSTITNEYGFQAGALTGATNTYGFHSNIANGSGQYNFYANGTANNYFAGNTAIGTDPIDTATLKVGYSDTNTSNVGQMIYVNASIPETNTLAAYGVNTQFTTVAGSFTLTNKFHFRATAATALGAGSAITNEYGFYADALTGATNTHGFHSNIADASGAYNFNAAGTAPNSFSGDVVIRGAGKLGYTTGSGGSVTQETSRTTGVTLNKTNGAITLVSAAGTATWQTFTVTNSTVAATDTVHICQKSGTDLNMVHITNVANGSFKVSFATTGGTTTEQPVFNFSVIKGVVT